MDLHVLTHSFPTRRSSDLDFARLTRELFLPPHRRDGARDRDEVGRRREQHLALERIVPKLVVLIERGGEEMLAGDEHHDEIGRVVELIRSEEHTSELQSLMRISYAVFCLTKKKAKQ